ncbi:MAG: hypothetical protein QW292_03245 [Candidatus Parvarchaeota archaeon]
MNLDSPYISFGKKYRHSITVQDMVDLKKAMDGHQGGYLLNLLFYDIEMNDIFSRPNKAIGYANPLVEYGKKR